ncbi:DUF4262 domain-containing protein, partial [Burkholderia seminalis]
MGAPERRVPRRDGGSGRRGAVDGDAAATWRHGWFCTEVLAEGDEPGFSFTTGLWVDHGFPEIIVFSLPVRIAHDVPGDAYRMAACQTPSPLHLVRHDSGHERATVMTRAACVIAVGMPITGHPPHRSRRAQFGHRAPT